MQGFNRLNAPNEGQFELTDNADQSAAPTGQSGDWSGDRRNRVDRRRTRNRVFEARARDLGMAIDRRRRPGWAATLLSRCAMLLRPRNGLHGLKDETAVATEAVSGRSH